MATTIPPFVERMLRDRHYAEELRSKAVAAVTAGQHSEAWEAYFGMPELASVASDPETLASLGADAGAAACTCNSTTVTTTTSPICTGTTTTSSG